MRKSITTTLAHTLSILLHPALVVIYITLIFLHANPYIFNGRPTRYVVYVVIYTIIYPVISVLLLRATGLLSDLSMPEKKDRIAPYILTIVFFLWFFVNTLSNPDYPLEFNTLLLGGVLAVILCFFVNIWDKVSLHVCAMTLLTTSVILIATQYSSGYMEIYWPNTNHLWRISLLSFSLVLAVLTVLLMMARVYLGKHTQGQVYGGSLIGILSPILALRIIDYVQ